MAATATLSKDVIDLFEKKVALLTEQIESLTAALEKSESQKTDLRIKVINLEQELERSRPKQAGLDDTAKKFVQALFKSGSYLDFEYVASMFGVPKGMAAYYRDILAKAGMIRGTGVVMDDALGSYELTSRGREFAVANGLT